MKPSKKGLARLIDASGYSWQGLTATYKHEAAFREELLLGAILLPLALWLGESALESALMIACWFLVIIVEIINSAIEAVVDRLGSEHHELSGRAKDMGSAAVLIALINLVMVWIVLLFF
jgi:diacylglycerol kinase (ATP)